MNKRLLSAYTPSLKVVLRSPGGSCEVLRLIILVIPAKAFARDYVITGVGLSVCLFVCLFVTTITK